MRTQVDTRQRKNKKQTINKKSGEDGRESKVA
jgi:hypothetical protein